MGHWEYLTTLDNRYINSREAGMISNPRFIVLIKSNQAANK